MKKKLPLTVLESLEKFVQLNGEQFEIHAHEKFMLSLSDNDKNSDFFFNIEECKNENGLKLLIGWKPINKDNIISKRMWIDCKDLEIYFNNWIIVLKGYEKVNSFFDDPILNSYAEDYYSEFIIVDEDLETIPFKPQQILMLDAHLETIEDNIEKYKTEVNNEQIDDIKKDINELRGKLTIKSRKWIIRNISIIWAKITKLGTPLLKEFLSEAKKTVVREGIKYMIEQGAGLVK